MIEMDVMECSIADSAAARETKGIPQVSRLTAQPAILDAEPHWTARAALAAMQCGARMRMAGGRSSRR